MSTVIMDGCETNNSNELDFVASTRGSRRIQHISVEGERKSSSICTHSPSRG